jgi:hypothetical protein
MEKPGIKEAWLPVTAIFDPLDLLVRDDSFPTGHASGGRYLEPQHTTS